VVDDLQDEDYEEGDEEGEFNEVDEEDEDESNNVNLPEDENYTQTYSVDFSFSA
jgi:hypothetical protein